MNNPTIEKLVSIVHDLFDQNKALREQLTQLEVNYQELADDYIKLQLENTELKRSDYYVNTTMAAGTPAPGVEDRLEDLYNPVPMDQLATVHPEEPKKDNGIFPSPASVSNSMVTGTTDDRCYALTAVLQELPQGVSVSKRVLIEQHLFEYKIDDSGHNRYQPTEWFREYALAHGILAEFTGHAATKSGEKVFKWYKVTNHGKQIIKDTAYGNTTWKQYINGPSEWDGYIPISTIND